MWDDNASSHHLQIAIKICGCENAEMVETEMRQRKDGLAC